MTEEEIQHLFTYHPPNQVQVLKYKAIAKAERECHMVFREAIDKVVEVEDIQGVFQTLTKIFFVFALAINEHAPDGADKSAAIRCVRLARMAANETIMVLRMAEKEEDLNHRQALMGKAGRSSDIFEAELTKARWQANAAIACAK